MKNVEKKTLGVVELLTRGFELILQHPWALLVPVALDFFLWLGPQINAKPLFQQMIALLAASVPADAPAETLQSAALYESALQTAADTVNLFGVTALGVPTVIGLQPPTPTWARAAWFVVGDGAALIALVALLGLAAILLASVYFTTIARTIRNDAGGFGTFVRHWAKSCVDMTALGILVLLGLFVLMLPISIGAAVLSIVNQGLGFLLVLGGIMLVFWMILYLAFALPAIFVSGANAPQAVINSISVFRFDFWSALGLVFLVYVVRTGFAVVWQLFGGNPWGIVFDVIANAFLSSGLVAAGMLFYYDRMNWLAAVREHLQQQRTQIKG